MLFLNYVGIVICLERPLLAECFSKYSSLTNLSPDKLAEQLEEDEQDQIFGW